MNLRYPLTVMLLCNLLTGLQAQIKIAFVGADISREPVERKRAEYSIPLQLQKLLGRAYRVDDFEVKGCSLLDDGDSPYTASQEYRMALNSNPNIVFIEPGSNDAAGPNHRSLDRYTQDCTDLIKAFLALPSHPRVVLLQPLVCYVGDTDVVSDAAIVKEVIPRLQQAAYLSGAEILDMHALLTGRPDLFPDQLHPDTQGVAVVARRLQELLMAKRDTAYDLFGRLSPEKTISSFYGFLCADFSFRGRQCKVVKPKWASPAHPWVWRARFWGHEPQADIALLERGYHIVYCDVAELFGNSDAVSLWNDFYHLLNQAGLYRKAVMEGMSRGGVYVYNWAAENADKVSCVYADNPVLDLKSWPGGKGKGPGSKNDWEKVRVDFSLKTSEDELAFAGSPIDKIRQIVKGKYPMLHVLADADEIVPPEENTLPFAQLVRELGGDITILLKPGFRHHPHSLPNPKPIVDFIMKYSP